LFFFFFKGEEVTLFLEIYHEYSFIKRNE